MALDYAHEKAEDLTDKTLDLRRAVASMIEEFEAATWYQERIDACRDPEFRAILAHNRDEEKEHAAMLAGVDPSQRLGPGEGAQGLHVHRRAHPVHRGRGPSLTDARSSTHLPHRQLGRS